MRIGYAKDFHATELMAIAAAKEIRNGDRVFVGIGLPMIAGFLAIYRHAPDTSLMFEGGYIGGRPLTACTDVGDSALGYQAPYVTSLWRTFSDLQRGYCDLAIIGSAQIDRFGNVNSTAIFHNSTYENPTVRLPGSGGANDMASSAQRTIIMARLERRRFVPKVDYVTSPGYLGGFDQRRKSGLIGEGPRAVITDKAIFRFDDTGEMYLHSLYPDMSAEEVEDQVGWDLKVAEKIETVDTPTKDDIEFIRNYDPTDVILRRRRAFSSLDFPSWVQIVYESWRKIKLQDER